MAGEIEGELVWTDLRNNSALHLQMTRMDRAVFSIMLFWLAFLAIGGTYFFLRDEMNSKPLLQLYAILVLFGFLYWLSRRQADISAKKRFLQMKNASLSHYALGFTDKGIRVPKDAEEILFPWSRFIFWKEDRNTLLMYLSNNEYLFIPKRLCSDPAMPDELRARLKAAGIRDAFLQVGFRSVATVLLLGTLTILFFSVVFIPSLLR